MVKEVPVYLFTGFLEAGKTKFIQETMEDPRFSEDHEPTLLLVCEEGELEYEVSRFADPRNTFLEVLEDPEKINPVELSALLKKHKAERVICEYNGMWDLDDFFNKIPGNWTVYQEFCFMNATTFLTYNANMRQQVYNKLQTCDCVVFNRWKDDMDMMAFHKIVRGANKRTSIVYEKTDGTTIPDTIKDPLPYDLSAPVCEIRDKDYAVWYRDMDEEMDKYEGKTVRVKGIAANSSKLPKGVFVIGREVMTCCEADIQMAGLACEWVGEGEKPEPRTWVLVTAKIAIKASKAYGGDEGPVLLVERLEKTEAPEEAVCSFY